MFAEPGRQDGRILLGIRGDVQTMSMWKGVCDRFINALQEKNGIIAQKCFRYTRGQRTRRERNVNSRTSIAFARITHPNVLFQKNQMNGSQPTPRIILPSNGSSTSSSICLRVPSFMSFSVKISDGTSSLIISPSSSDFASHLSHGNVMVSEPWSKHGRDNLFKTTRTHVSISPLKILWRAGKDFQLM